MQEGQTIRFELGGSYYMQTDPFYGVPVALAGAFGRCANPYDLHLFGLYANLSFAY